ncbi:MAG TPA: AraC family transcriptional regulator [Gaiellaceae bacterium]|nr:AraC family transcriptional regulator [Gaiellaceae bacterium]
MSATRIDLVREGARATRAEVGPFEIQLLTFAANHRIPAFDVDRGYVVVVLEGTVAKGFGRLRWTLARDSLATMPVGAAHTSDFGPAPTKVLAVRSRDAEADAFGELLRRLRHVRASASTAIGWRIASELRAGDESWPLAAEGLVLQLLSTAGRAERSSPRRGCWVRDARELLHELTPASLTLSELAAAVGVDPAHLARSFRREFGVTVGQYARGLRLDWASAQLALPDASLAEVAAGAGFADQSHFTRAFRAYAGVTPGRYRELLRR